MSDLVLCAECNRHVRGGACPFCGARVLAAQSSAIGRASRAALFALAASACKETPTSTVTDAAEAHEDAATTPTASASATATASAAPSASAVPSATASARAKPTTSAPAVMVRPAVTAYGGPPANVPKL